MTPFRGALPARTAILAQLVPKLTQLPLTDLGPSANARLDIMMTVLLEIARVKFVRA